MCDCVGCQVCRTQRGLVSTRARAARGGDLEREAKHCNPNPASGDSRNLFTTE